MPIKMTRPTFKRTTKRLENLNRIKFDNILREFGDRGVRALAAATPVDTSQTANSWSYKLIQNGEHYKISWSNSVMAGSVPLVILLQYGHGTGTGGYVSGRNFINPALEPIYAELKRRLIAEVIR
jgi:hypothetical protein